MKLKMKTFIIEDKEKEAFNNKKQIKKKLLVPEQPKDDTKRLFLNIFAKKQLKKLIKLFFCLF